jgi:hypothetical protein
VPLVSCLEIDTGALRWQRPAFDVLDVKPLDSKKLLLETTGRLVACAIDSGEVAWQVPLPVEAGGVLCNERLTIWTAPGSAAEGARLALHWLDSQTGRSLGQASVEFPVGERAAGSAISMLESKLILLGTDDRRRPERDLIELSAADDAPFEVDDGWPLAWRPAGKSASKTKPK